MNIDIIYRYLSLLNGVSYTIKELSNILNLGDNLIRVQMKILVDLRLVDVVKMRRHNNYHRLVNVYRLNDRGRSIYSKLYDVNYMLQNRKVYKE